MRKLLYITLLALSCRCAAQPISYIAPSLYVPYTAPAFPTTNIKFFTVGTQVVQSSNAISQWTDQSTNNSSYAQASAGAKPTWTNSSKLTFDGSSDFMVNPFDATTSGGADMNLYVSFSTSNAAQSFGCIYQVGQYNVDEIGIYITANSIYVQSISSGGSTGAITSSVTLVNNTKYVVHVKINATLSEMEVGATQNTGVITPSANYTDCSVGAAELTTAAVPGTYFQGDIYAAALYGTQSGADITATKAVIATY